MDRRRNIGKVGERIAAECLVRRGYRLVDRNYRTRDGELDLVMSDGGTLVFCEVKTLVARPHGGSGPLHPLEAVGRVKRTRIRRMARAWMADRADGVPRWRAARFDAIGVLLSPAGTLLRLEHVEAAF